MGYVAKEYISTSKLADLNFTMKSRGPDDHGEEQFNVDKQCVGMDYRRLPTMKLSYAGTVGVYY